jgi:DNA-binding CsgD family transcriptional regulator
MAILHAAADTIAVRSSAQFPRDIPGQRRRSEPCPSSAETTALAEWNLTQREHEVLTLLRQRLTDAEIATALSISRRTASSHVGRIMSKLSANNRREAVAIALGRCP